MGVYDQMELAESAARKASTGKEFGASGTTNFGGILSDTDYNNEWAPGYGSRKWKTIDRMRRSDGQVKGTLQYCKQPIAAATWSIQPVGDTGQDRQISEFVEWNLFRGLARGWRYGLLHLLKSLEFGFMVMEKVWAIDKAAGRVYCAKLAPRLPSTIYRWNVDEATGELVTVEQMVTTGTVEPMPADKILHFALDMEGDNWEGESILRSAWKHWRLKETFEKVAGMSYERFGMGLPVFTEPDDADTESRDRVDAIGEAIRAHEKGYVRLPNDWGFDIKFGSGWKSPNAEIRYHNEMISAGILQQFTNLGSTETGSRAVGEVLQDPYYLALEGMANQICELLNTRLIPELVDYNWSGVKDYPELRVSNIRAQSIEVVAAALDQLANKGFVLADLETERHLRKLMHLPELNEAEREQKQEMPKPEAQPGPEDGDEGKPPEGQGLAEGVRPFALAEFRMRREPTDVEACVAFADIDDRQRSEVARAADEFRRVRAEQAAQLASDVADMVVAGRVDPNRIKLAKFGKAASVVKASMQRARQYGAEQIRAELKRQRSTDTLAARAAGEKAFKDAKKKPPTGPIDRLSPDFEDVAANRADLVVVGSGEQMISDALTTGAGLAKEVGLSRAAIEERIAANLAKLSDKTIESLFSGAFMEAFNEGRAETAAEMAAEFRSATRSGLLDENVCDTCAERDGEDFEVEDAVEQTLPDPDCAGGDRCRCMMVYTAKEEEEALR